VKDKIRAAWNFICNLTFSNAFTLDYRTELQVIRLKKEITELKDANKKMYTKVKIEHARQIAHKAIIMAFVLEYGTNAGSLKRVMLPTSTISDARGYELKVKDKTKNTIRISVKKLPLKPSTSPDGLRGSA
jgi:hypothetical protein